MEWVKRIKHLNVRGFWAQGIVSACATIRMCIVLLSLSFFARRNDFVMPPSKVDLVDGGWSWLWLEQPRR